MIAVWIVLIFLGYIAFKFIRGVIKIGVLAVLALLMAELMYQSRVFG